MEHSQSNNQNIHELIINKKILKIENLLNEKEIKYNIKDLPGYSLKIVLEKDQVLLEIYEKIIKKYCFLNDKSSKKIYYGFQNLIDFNLILSYVWILHYYYSESIHLLVILLPKLVDKEQIINSFNENIIINKKYYLTLNLDIISLENLNKFANKSNDTILILGCADLSLRDLNNLNKRRINTILEKGYKKITIFSVCPLVISNFKLLNIDNEPFYNLLLDKCIVTDIDSTFINEFIINNSKNKIYLSLDFPVNELKQLVNELNNIQSNGVRVIRSIPNEFNDEIVVLNNSLKTINTFFNSSRNINVNSFNIYIIKLPKLSSDLDILNYLKIFTNIESIHEIYIDDESMNTLESAINYITHYSSYQTEKINLVDSNEFSLLEDLNEFLTKNNKGNNNNNNIIYASEKYILIDSSINPKIKKLDLSNLGKKELEEIRNYIKIKLYNLLHIDFKTCQLASPSSPNNRNRNLNNLSNRINSIDYFCEITCEIFKDYKIGIVIWTDFFYNKKDFKNLLLKDNIYVYQTTKGTWRYSVNK